MDTIHGFSRHALARPGRPRYSRTVYVEVVKRSEARQATSGAGQTRIGSVATAASAVMR
jgi:hypothetical protein